MPLTPLFATLALAGMTPTPAARPAWPDPATEARMKVDWAWLGRYRAADQALEASGQRPEVVFIGDSITQGWTDKAPAFFHAGVVGRGISGQTSPQMLVRFRQDVLDLRPRVVHIMMGTNDIAGNTGPMSTEETEANFMTMAELARAHGIGVVIASIPPAASFPWKPGVETVEKIRALNGWLRAYAERIGAVYADYTAVLDDGRGGMRPGLASDGVHPTSAGYALMAPVAEKAIAEALGGERGRPFGRP
jgi:lysophospholipase L1-like esterase